MTEHIHAPQVGAPDPERTSSPIVEETDEDFEIIGQEVPEAGGCYFNGTLFGDGHYVCSGSELLLCNRGAWLREGSCDPDHPG